MECKINQKSINQNISKPSLNISSLSKINKKDELNSSISNIKPISHIDNNSINQINPSTPVSSFQMYPYEAESSPTNYIKSNSNINANNLTFLTNNNNNSKRHNSKNYIKFIKITKDPSEGYSIHSDSNQSDFTLTNISNNKGMYGNNTNINLNSIKEEENYSNKDEQQEHSSEDENLGYNSNYVIQKCTKNISDNKNIEDNSIKSKASTAISFNESSSEQTNIFYSGYLKNENFERKESYNLYKNINFTRERLNSTPVTNYFEGIDFYLRGIQPEKNDYTKSGNFIEKEKFFNEKDFSFKNMKYKSFDLSEQKRFMSNLALKNTEENIYNTNNNTIFFPPQNKMTQINIENKIQNSTINNINIINNQPMIMQMPQNTENGEGKFDMPMYFASYIIQ